jgi:peptide deformylase
MPPFVIYPHPALTLVASPRPVDSDMLAAGAALLRAAQDVQAHGLAAAHLGLDEPLIVLNVATDRNQRDYRVLFNPRVSELADEVIQGPEGSVSMPGIEVPVERAIWAVVEYDTAEGIGQTSRFEGFTARVAQHEIDQMNGVFFLDRLSRVKRDMALRKFRKRQ